MANQASHLIYLLVNIKRENLALLSKVLCNIYIYLRCVCFSVENAIILYVYSFCFWLFFIYMYAVDRHLLVCVC